jgi:cbb3-type cytochrome oxidase subunit 3
MLRRKLRTDQPTLLRSLALIVLALFAAPLPAFSQSCALCYTQAASAGARMIQALQSGILILILPPTLMSIAMIFIVYHKRNQVRRAEEAPERTW